MHINLPDNVKKIIDALEQNGFEAYAVGGCVRDAILSREPQDWDITTSALPEQVKKIFPYTIDTGIQHGTVTVMLDKVGYEVTTYRIDGEYEDCRHPKDVTFTTDLSEDLLRRDFTINAMAYNERDGLVDLFHGVEDLQNGIIRCVGEPSERIDEDALRILRAFRFAAALGFSIDDATMAVFPDKAQNLSKVSAERIREELNKLLISKNPDRLFDASLAGVTKVVLPEFDAILKGGKDAQGLNGIRNRQAMSSMKTMKAVSLVGSFDDKDLFTPKEKLILKWAALLSGYADCDIFTPDIAEFTETKGEKPEDRYDAVNMSGIADAEAKLKHDRVREVMSRLKFDNETRDLVVRLVDAHNLKLVLINDVSIRQFMKKVGKDLCPMLFELMSANLLADGFVTIGEINMNVSKSLPKITKARETYNAIIERGDCTTIDGLAINGNDLITAGFDKGPEIGRMLDLLLNKVIIDQSLNDKQKLIDIACMNY